MTDANKGRTRAMKPFRFIAFAAALLVAVAGTGNAHTTKFENGYQDSFNTPGPLPADPGDPWETPSGVWQVDDQAIVSGAAQAGTNRVLRQLSRGTTPVRPTDPNEPMAFVRARSFKQFTAQVTAALIDDVTTASVGLVFRAPIDPDTNSADKDNLYLFAGVNTGVIGPFTTGHAFVLFKRVGRGYYFHPTKIVNTYADLTKPHEYKVTMASGRIQAWVDGRLLVDHTDIPSGDEPTTADPFPGLPYESGAVGLRTTSARAWFDNFSVVGTDAYEGRAVAIDGFQSYEHGGLRRGHDINATSLTKLGDTGYQYHDHDFDQAVLKPYENVGGPPSAGASVRTQASGGVVTSTVRLAGAYAVFSDPEEYVKVEVRADALEARAWASCVETGSTVNFTNALISVTLMQREGAPGVTVSLPLRTDYPPDKVLFEHGTLVKIVANARTDSSPLRRMDLSALKIIFPNSLQKVGPMPVKLPVPLPNGANQVTVPEVAIATTPRTEIDVARLVAGRFCA